MSESEVNDVYHGPVSWPSPDNDRLSMKIKATPYLPKVQRAPHLNNINHFSIGAYSPFSGEKSFKIHLMHEMC